MALIRLNYQVFAPGNYAMKPCIKTDLAWQDTQCYRNYLNQWTITKNSTLIQKIGNI